MDYGTYEWLMRLGRFVLAPPHADCGYECRESDLSSAAPSVPSNVSVSPALHDSVTAPWNTLPTCAASAHQLPARAG